LAALTSGTHFARSPERNVEKFSGVPMRGSTLSLVKTDCTSDDLRTLIDAALSRLTMFAGRAGGRDDAGERRKDEIRTSASTNGGQMGAADVPIGGEGEPTHLSAHNVWQTTRRCFERHLGFARDHGLHRKSAAL